MLVIIADEVPLRRDHPFPPELESAWDALVRRMYGPPARALPWSALVNARVQQGQCARSVPLPYAVRLTAGEVASGRLERDEACLPTTWYTGTLTLSVLDAREWSPCLRQAPDGTPAPGMHFRTAGAPTRATLRLEDLRAIHPLPLRRAQTWGAWLESVLATPPWWTRLASV